MAKFISSSDFEEIMEEAGKCVNNYERYLKENKYTINLSNGDFFNVRIKENQVPHLLGIDPSALKVAGIVKKDESSYEILKKLTTGDLTYYDILQGNKGFNMSNLFSDYVRDKIRIFSSNIKIKGNDIMYVIKYDTKKTYITGEQPENSDYFIVRNINRNYGVLGIANEDPEKRGFNYAPVTSRSFGSFNELKPFLAKVLPNQEITYPVISKIENIDSQFAGTFIPRVEEKKTLLERITNLALEYSAIASVGKDYSYTLSRLLNGYQKDDNNRNVIELLNKYIKTGNVLPKEVIACAIGEDQLPDEINDLIDTCNDLICSNIKVSGKTESSYSVIQKENGTLKNELEACKKELEKIKEEKKALEETNHNLDEENELNKIKLKIFIDASKTVTDMDKK